jgi:hypothetical protein
VNVATLESAGQPCPAVLEEVHLDAGMTASVGSQEDREQGLDHLRCGADSEHSRFTALEGACSVSERVGICHLYHFDMVQLTQNGLDASNTATLLCSRMRLTLKLTTLSTL